MAREVSIAKYAPRETKEETAAILANMSTAKAAFGSAVAVTSDDSSKIATYSTVVLKAMIGASADRLSVTFLRNIRREKAAVMFEAECQAKADAIKARLISIHPDVDVVVKRGGQYEVWPDGKPASAVVGVD